MFCGFRIFFAKFALQISIGLPIGAMSIVLPVLAHSDFVVNPFKAARALLIAALLGAAALVPLDQTLAGALPLSGGPDQGFTLPGDLGFVPRADWFGDPYLLTNPPDNALSPSPVSVVLNPLMVTNQAYQLKVAALVAAYIPPPLEHSSDPFRNLFRPRADSANVSGFYSPVPAYSSSQHRDFSALFSWITSTVPLFLERWLLFALVTAFLARRLWRFFREAPDNDDDFADHLSTLAVAHRWIFPVYLSLLAAVAIAEFFQFGNLFLSLSGLCLACTLRRYYCEGDFADHPGIQKIHFLLSLALLYLGWAQVSDHYLSDITAWFHWRVIGWVALAVALRALTLLYNSELAAHRRAVFLFAWAFAIASALGGFAGYYCWLHLAFPGSPWYGFALTATLICLPLQITFSRWLTHVAQQRFSAFLLNVIFSEGTFAEKSRRQKHVPELLLLQHWRDSGQVDKAWHAASGHLLKEERALPLWLFAMETAVLHRRKPDDALKILRDLCNCDAFHYDQREVAIGQMDDWMTAAGFKFNAAAYHIERPVLRPTQITGLIEQKFRQGRPREAAALLQQILRNDSLNEPAFIQLVRVHCQDLKNRPAAQRLIDGARDTFGPNVLDYLERSLDEWIQLPARTTPQKTIFDWFRPAEAKPSAPRRLSVASPPITQPNPPPKANGMEAYLERVKQSRRPGPQTAAVFDAVDKLLVERRLGTAVDLIKQKAEAAPADFDLWLRYAEAYGHHCSDIGGAEKIIRQMERSGNFTKTEMKKAYTRLKRWRKLHANHQSGW